MKFVVFAVFIGCMRIAQCCSNSDTIENKWDRGHSGYVVVPAKSNDNVSVTFSGEILKAEFYCLKLTSQTQNTYVFSVKAWCPQTKAGLKLGYALYFTSDKKQDRVHFTEISVNNKLYCNDTYVKTKQESGTNAADCTQNVKIDNNLPGGQDGTITLKPTKNLQNWKIVAGFDRDVTGFNINEAQPDAHAQDPCAQINTHECYLFNANMTAGTVQFKYYMSFVESQGVPKIVYVGLYDTANSYTCGTKPKCP